VRCSNIGSCGDQVDIRAQSVGDCEDAVVALILRQWSDKVKTHRITLSVRDRQKVQWAFGFGSATFVSLAFRASRNICGLKVFAHIWPVVAVMNVDIRFVSTEVIQGVMCKSE
jgi:hypothetical protein